MPRPQRNAIWLLGGGLAATRILLLAHWTSDVLVGLAIGAATERSLRKLVGYGCAVPATISPSLSEVPS